MIVQDTTIQQPILQNLVPVLTEDDVLHGIIQTGVNEWHGASATLEFPTRKIILVAKEFIGENTSRQLMCAVFPVILTKGREPWNGIPNFLSAEKMGYFSVWAIPVMNPGYNRVTIGELKLFTSNKLDPIMKDKNNPVSPTAQVEKETIVVKANIGVSVYKFNKRFSFVEFNWVDLFRRKLETVGITEQCFMSVQTVQSPTVFKTLCYNSTTSSAVPYILQIMRVSRELPDVGTYEFVLEVMGKNRYLFHITLNLKS